MTKTAMAATWMCVLVLSGCDQATAPHSSSGDSFQTVLAETIALAEADPSVGAEQRSQLASLAESGEVTLEDFKSALSANSDCLLDAGFTAGTIVVAADAIPPFPSLSGFSAPVSMDQSEADLIVSGCEARHVKYISRAYTFQPQSQQLYWSKADALAPSMRECMVAHGVPTDLTGESTADTVNAAVKLFLQYGDFDGFPSADCLQGLPMPTANR